MIEVDYTRAVHVRENTKENEAHLNANRQKFTGQVAIVLTLLLKGHRLTSYAAMTQWHISRLASRIHDLRQAGVGNIIDKFVMDKDGKTTRFKEYFINCKTDVEKKEADLTKPGHPAKKKKSYIPTAIQLPLIGEL